MKTFKVPVSYEVYGYVEVEAKDLDDLKEKLNNDEFVSNMPLPDNPEYVDSSYEVNMDVLEDLI